MNQNIYLLIAIGVALLFGILWLNRVYKVRSQKAEKAQLSLSIRFLEEFNRKNIKNFPLDILNRVVCYDVKNYVENLEEKITDLYWRIFYQDNDTIRLDKLDSYTFSKESDIEKMGQIAWQLEGNMCFTVKECLSAAFKAAMLKARSQNLAFIVLYVIKADVSKMINLNRFENNAKKYILETIKTEHSENFINLFISELEDGQKTILEDKFLGHKEKIIFESEIIKITESLK